MKIRKLHRMPVVSDLLAVIMWLYLIFVRITSRWEFVENVSMKSLKQSKQSNVFVFWHGRIALILPFVARRGSTYAIISPHKDGRIAAKVARLFGVKNVSGSSNKNAVSAAKKIINISRTNNDISVAIDGPRGPRLKVGGQICKIAAIGNLNIYPVSYSCSKYKIFNSWDKFMFPFPFGKGAFMIGKPINAGLYKDKIEDLEKEVEKTLTEMLYAGDEKFGVEKILPQLHQKVKRDIHVS